MTLVLVGISHHRAPVELRERVALDLGQAGAFARTLAAAEGIEAVCLSTCNRTELYVSGQDVWQVEAQAGTALDELAGGVPPALAAAFYRLRGEAAALHLYRVAAGLDSMVPGEGEILGQVRAAYEAGAPGPVLDHVFREAVHAGKKVRTQTAIAESPASVSAAAAALAQQVFGELAGCRIVLVGAGKATELAARNLLSRGARISYVVNRSPERAAALAEQVGARPLALEELGSTLAEADVVVSSTSAPGFVLRREDLAAALPARRGRPFFLIDLAVPRDLDPAIHELQDCYLYDIDDLEAVVAESLAGRRREAERAEAIVAEQAERFRQWEAALDVVPAITSLRARAEEIRAAELARLGGRLGELSESDWHAVESATARIVDKLLHLPTVRMKQAAVTADGVLYADAVRHLFGLGEEER